MERIAPLALATPRTLGEAAALLARTPGARLLAGGTDLVANLRHGLERPPLLVDLAAIGELDTLAVHPSGTTIGAGVTLARLATDAGIARTLPALADAARTIAGPAHRTAATVGGNLCLDTRCVFYNQSEWWRRSNSYCLKRGGDTCHVAPQGKRCHAAFSGDLAPVFIVLDSRVRIIGFGGMREIALADLYVEDGLAHLALARDEIVASVHVPAQPSGARTGYRKARARGAIDFPLAGVAARVTLDGARVAAMRVALTGTNSRPFLLDGTDSLVGAAVADALLVALGKLVQKQAGPMRTTVTHSHYRRQAAAALAQRLVRDLASGDA